MKIGMISDTHLFHPVIDTECDIMIHAGDAGRYGTTSEIKKFIKWYRYIPAKHKLFVPGNHDACMEDSRGQDLFKATGIKLLMGESIEIDGIKIWGSPVTPQFYDWSFMMSRGEDIGKHWNEIPLDTDIVITHGPPFGIGDAVPNAAGRRNAGCIKLLNRIYEVRPKIHVFGHIHEGAGLWWADDISETNFVNASSVDWTYTPRYGPRYIDL
jgi:Icc-related predicted phosphoesterase